MSKNYYKKPEETVNIPVSEPIVEEKPKEEVLPVEEKKEVQPVKSYTREVKYREVVYLGTADTAERIGIVTGNTYVFKKDSFGMPVATQVDEKDYAGLIVEKGRGCARRDASILFMSKLEWDLEIEQARIANSA